MSVTIQYMMFMLASKFSKTLHFDKYNITEFLERFEEQCDEYKCNVSVYQRALRSSLATAVNVVRTIKQ